MSDQLDAFGAALMREVYDDVLRKYGVPPGAHLPAASEIRDRLAASTGEERAVLQALVEDVCFETIFSLLFAIDVMDEAADLPCRLRFVGPDGAVIPASDLVAPAGMADSVADSLAELAVTWLRRHRETRAMAGPTEGAGTESIVPKPPDD
ncbi:MAG: hypothetical protein AAFR46_00645 [Pseudomonadota bacterium]